MPGSGTQRQDDTAQTEESAGIGSMRAAATWLLDQKSLPGYATLKAYEKDLRKALDDLIPQIEQHAGARPEDDIQGKVALAGVGKARRRLGLPEREGLQGEYERVKKLAMSVIALCDHVDALTGIHMCLLCDKKIEDGESLVSYGKVSPSGGAVSAGQVHAACAKAAR